MREFEPIAGLWHGAMRERKGGAIGQGMVNVLHVQILPKALDAVTARQTLAVGERAHAGRTCLVAAGVVSPPVEVAQGHGRVRNVRVAGGQCRALVEALMDGVGPGVGYGSLIRLVLCTEVVAELDYGAVGKDCRVVLGQERGHFAATADASGRRVLNATN